MSTTTYQHGSYFGQHVLTVNPTTQIVASDEHRCVDIFLKKVIKVENRLGYIVVTTLGYDGRKHYVYIHHNVDIGNTSTEVTA